MSELTHRIDEATGKCSKVEDLFSPALVSLRLKLRECSGASIKSDEYISGALDISWRKASYEVLHVAKRLRKSQSYTYDHGCFMLKRKQTLFCGESFVKNVLI